MYELSLDRPLSTYCPLNVEIPDQNYAKTVRRQTYIRSNKTHSGASVRTKASQHLNCAYLVAAQQNASPLFLPTLPNSKLVIVAT